jgi:hypothetical protein
MDANTECLCLRCEAVLAREPVNELKHAPRCPFRDTGRDPEPVELEDQSGGR